MGSIPTHWEASQLKRVCTFEYGDSLAAESRVEGDVQVYGSNGPVGKHNSSNTCGSTLVIGRKGSFGKVNYSTSPVFAIDTTFFVDSRYTHAHLRWLYYVLTVIRLDASTKDSAIPGLDREDAYAQMVPICDLVEQYAIAVFLDRETAKIDALVAKKERLIELLQEKRAALISRAVTNGLDPNVPMKDSGVEWFGEIPSDWEMKRLKYLAGKIGSGKTPKGGAGVYVNDGIMLIRSQNVHFGGLRLADVVYIDTATDSGMSGSRVKEGDVLLNITGASLGRCCVAFLDGSDANVNQHVCIVRPNQQRDNPSYLAYSMESHSLQDQIFNSENGVSRDAINFEQIADLILMMPALVEQRAIVSYLDGETAKFDALIKKVREAIKRLNELRAALISAAVAGRIDVRKEAA